tara:strand:+ start:479 stop:733 length:255 start_codon:yes stop_codon:yes gene_type:complete
MTTANIIDEIVTQQVSHGLSSSRVEAEQKLSANLVERELDRKIAKGRQDIKDGNFTSVNEKTTAEFIERLSKKLIPEHRNNGIL